MTCRKCGSPVTTAMKFCVSCGARIEPGPVCPQCNAPLGPDVKFCESCGKPVAAAAPVVPVTTLASAVENLPVSPQVVPETIRASGDATPLKDIKQPEVSHEPAEERPAEPHAKAHADLPPGPGKEASVTPVPEKALPQKTVLVAGILVLALLSAAGYFVVLPMLSGTATIPQGPVVPTAPPAPAGSSAPSALPASGSGTVSLTAGPTQVPPFNRAVIVDVDRDAISSVITVIFQGGEGQYGVRELAVTLTRSDGTVEIKSFKPEFRGTSITLQGTDRTDRVEVTANFYNGESYKVVDKVFEYKKRVG